ncbi:ATP synthase subunit I [Bacillus sp. 165]|uniref:ATP synthase subunit I n=1 Tax=Bacillus sp. 165 TaxID=1529117 RepID=UPI001AD9DEB5|nr:ATP synthase subunit I [Bacillus sp. 165]MBO9130068.1 ATP synthase subunit I [Bacillus sp. 165]
MVEMHELITRQKKYMYYLLALFVLGWGFTTYRAVFLGLILGTIVSFFGLRLVARRTDKLLDRVTEGKKVKARAKAVSTYSRLATIGLLVILAVRYKDLIEVWALGIGLMTGHLVMIIDFLYLQYIKGREER